MNVLRVQIVVPDKDWKDNVGDTDAMHLEGPDKDEDDVDD